MSDSTRRPVIGIVGRMMGYSSRGQSYVKYTYLHHPELQAKLRSDGCSAHRPFDRDDDASETP